MALFRPGLWQDLTRDEIAAARDQGALVAIPVGAIEQHGSHLPVDTDARIVTAVTRRAAAQTSRVPVIVAPTLPVGFSPHHLGHAGTISLRLGTYLAVLGDMAASVHGAGFGRIVFVNGHGGNSAPLRSKIAELVTEGIPATGIDYWAPDDAEWLKLLRGATKRFGHACEFETGLMLAVNAGEDGFEHKILQRTRGLPPHTWQPWVVPDGHADAVSDARAAWPPVFQGDDAGYQGDPAAATPDTGAALLAVVSKRLAAFFDAFATMPIRCGLTRPGEPPRISAPLVEPLP